MTETSEKPTNAQLAVNFRKKIAYGLIFCTAALTFGAYKLGANVFASNNNSEKVLVQNQIKQLKTERMEAGTDTDIIHANYGINVDYKYTGGRVIKTDTVSRQEEVLTFTQELTSAENHLSSLEENENAGLGIAAIALFLGASFVFSNKHSSRIGSFLANKSFVAPEVIAYLKQEVEDEKSAAASRAYCKKHGINPGD